MPRAFSRRHPIHARTWVGPVFFTWRLERSQPPLSDAERGVVFAIIKRLDGPGSSVRAGVVMDDHVHVLAFVGPSSTIQRAVHTWKSLSAHRLTKAHGRTAPVWQRGYWDRSIADSEAFQRCIGYIQDNPRKRWPTETHYRWTFVQ